LPAEEGLVSVVSAEINEKQPIKIKLKKMLPAVVAALVTVITAACLFIFMDFSSSVYGTVSDMLILEAEESTVIVFDNGSTGRIEGEHRESTFSLDGRTAAVLVNKDRNGNDWHDWHSWQNISTGTLYYINSSRDIIKVSDDVNGFVLSDSGNGIAYWKNLDINFDIAELYLFNGSESALIHIEAVYSGWDNIAVSPDGRTVFYLGDEEDRIVSFISTDGGKGERFREDIEWIQPIAIADNAQYLYYVIGYERFVVQKGIGAEEVRLCPSFGGGSGRTVFFNRDYSQVVVNTGGDARISINGEDSHRFSNVGVEYFIVPDNGQIRGISSGNGRVYGFTDFRNKVFCGEDSGLYLLNNDLVRGRFAFNAHNITLSNDGKMLYFKSGNFLNAASAVNAEAEWVGIASNINHYVLGRGGFIYYIDSQNNLIRTRAVENFEAVKVAENVDRDSLTASGNGTVYFVTDYSYLRNGGTLYFTTDATPRKIKDEVERVFSIDTNVYYFTNMDASGINRDIYRSPGNGRFNKIAEDVWHVVNFSNIYFRRW
jgi:hypothetical protein